MENCAIDLDTQDWVEIKKAASESPWMPPEYMQNDWVSDVCRFLREEKETPSDTELRALKKNFENLLRDVPCICEPGIACWPCLIRKALGESK